jgi:hypothetical protein
MLSKRNGWICSPCSCASAVTVLLCVSRYVDALTSVNQAGMRMLTQQKPAIITTAAAAAAAGAKAKSSSSKNSSSGGGGGSASPKLPGKGSRGSKGGGSSSGSSGSNAAAAAAATAAMLQAYSQQSALAQIFDDVYKLLSMGTVRVLLALPLLGMWAPPQLLFNSQAQRYDQRFASFHTVPRPDPLAYEQYVNSTDVTGASAEQLLRLAQADFAKVGGNAFGGGQGCDCLLRYKAVSRGVFKACGRTATVVNALWGVG